jgi:hypothetical protein
VSTNVQPPFASSEVERQARGVSTSLDTNGVGARDFPGLINADGSRWHYLGTAATAQKPHLSRPPLARTNQPPLWCSPLTQRTVPELARITTLSVVILPPLRRLTPRSSDPSVTPVAAKMQSPLASSSSL